MKAARISFIFMFPKWHTSEQEDAHDAAELWGAHLDEPRKVWSKIAAKMHDSNIRIRDVKLCVQIKMLYT